MDKNQNNEKLKIPRLCIMVIDDDKDIGESIEVAISLTENDTVYFSNPKEAVSEFEKSQDRFQAIFTDLRMPEMTGEQVISRIRKKDKTTPIVIITASRGIFSTEDLVKLNISSLISKPFDLHDIELAVKLVEEHYEKQQTQ